MKFFNPLVISFILLFCFKFCKAQDSLWQRYNVNEYVTISMPKNSTVIDTSITRKGVTYPLKGIKITQGEGSYAVTSFVTSTYTDINNPDILKESINGMKFGFLERSKQQGLQCEAFDTSFSNMPVIKGIIYNEENVHVYNYMFPIYDKAVNIIFSPLKGNSVEFNDKVNKILSSVKINKTDKKIVTNINKEDGDFFNKAKVIGEVISTLFLLGLFIWLISYIVKKNSKVK